VKVLAAIQIGSMLAAILPVATYAVSLLSPIGARISGFPLTLSKAGFA
jgi:hypothetical protein